MCSIPMSNKTAELFEMFKTLYTSIPRRSNRQASGPSSSYGCLSSEIINIASSITASNSDDSAGDKKRKKRRKKRYSTETAQQMNAAAQPGPTAITQENEPMSCPKQEPSPPLPSSPPQQATKEDEQKTHQPSMSMAETMFPASFSSTVSSLASSLLNALPSDLATLAKQLEAGLMGDPSEQNENGISPAMPLHFETYTTSREYRRKHGAIIEDSALFYPLDKQLQEHIDRELRSSYENQENGIKYV